MDHLNNFIVGKNLREILQITFKKDKLTKTSEKEKEKKGKSKLFHLWKDSSRNFRPLTEYIQRRYIAEIYDKSRKKANNLTIFTYINFFTITNCRCIIDIWTKTFLAGDRGEKGIRRDQLIFIQGGGVLLSSPPPLCIYTY